MIKVQTRENSLKGTAQAEYIFVVSTEDSLTTADVCRRSVENNGKVDYDTMMAAVSQYFHQERKDILEGKMINNLNYHVQPCAHGTTNSARGPWGGDQSHYLEARYTANPELKKELNAQHVQLINERIVGPQIGEVYDYKTHTYVNQPGVFGVTAKTITINRALGVGGYGLRIAPISPTELTVGIFFVKVGAELIEIRVPNDEIMHNDPSRLEFIIPALSPGEYYLEVRTRSATAGNKEVKEIRTVRYKHTVTAEQE